MLSSVTFPTEVSSPGRSGHLLRRNELLGAYPVNALARVSPAQEIRGELDFRAALLPFTYDAHPPVESRCSFLLCPDSDRRTVRDSWASHFSGEALAQLT